MKILKFSITGYFALCLGMNSLCFAEDLRDIRPPVLYPASFSLIFFFVVILFLIGLLFLIRWLRRRIKKDSNKKIPSDPPYVIAYRHLEELRRKQYISQGKIKEFFIELSDIVRKYIEDYFYMKAPEMTTEEFLWFLKDSDKLNVKHKDLLRNFLNCCDMVKFAKYGPSHDEIENSFLSAQRFVDETKSSQEVVTENKT